jgi:7-keto-8-aminopelargonate synthetase-like enzyme
MVRAQVEFGSGATAARSVGGVTNAIERAEARLSRFFAGEAAILFGTRNQAVLTMITTLCGEGVVVVTSPLCSLPLADACALVGADFVECESVDNLRTTLERYSLIRRVIVVVEASSPLTGEPVDISGWVMTAELAGAWIVIDETTALGLGGMRGAGSAEIMPASPALLARLVGFQYVIGSEVCAVVGSVELRELLLRRSRYLRHEPPPSSLAARLADLVVDIVELALLPREMLAARSALVYRALKAQGWQLSSTLPSPITSLWFDSLQKARDVQEAMLQRGVLVEALPARSLRRNGAVVRALLSNAHTQEEVDTLLTGFGEIRKRLEGPQR